MQITFYYVNCQMQKLLTISCFPTQTANKYFSTKKNSIIIQKPAKLLY